VIGFPWKRASSMTFAVYGEIPASGMNAKGERDHVSISKVAAVIRDVPEGTTEDEVNDRLTIAGRIVSDDARIVTETAWSPDIQRMVTQKTDPDIETLFWGTLDDKVR
jgi:hypothetical protein